MRSGRLEPIERKSKTKKQKCFEQEFNKLTTSCKLLYTLYKASVYIFFALCTL